MTNPFKILSVLMTTLMVGSTATAAPVLRQSITVNTPIVTVGDMFDNAGLISEEALFRAPAPGTTGEVSLSAVRDAALRVGLQEFENPGRSGITVARAGVIVSENTLNGALRS